MRYVFQGLSFALIPIIVSGILGYLRQPKIEEDGKVYLHKFLAVLGIIGSAVFLIPAVIVAFRSPQAWSCIPFLLLSLLSATLIIAFVNCRIVYDEEYFVSKNFLGIKSQFTYDQVTAIKENSHETYIYIGKKRVMVDKLSVGGETFIKFVKKKYRTLHDGKSLPKIYKTKHDLFNGNVRDAGGFLFAYILVGVLTVGLFIFSIYYTYAPSTPNNTIEQSVRFVSCEKSKEEITLTSSDNQIFKIRFTDEQFKVKKIPMLCDGKTLVITYSTEVTPKYEESYYSLQAIKYNDKYVLTFEETQRLHRQEYTSLVAIAGGMCLVWGAIVACSIIIGRNPKRFSKRVVKLFFKEESIIY